MNSTLFESAPFNGSAPSPVQLRAAASMGAGLGAHGRKALMNSIGTLLGIPPGGWTHGISRLFVNGDIRLVGLLRRLLRESYCKAVSANLARARQYVDIDLMLTMCTAARESDASLSASGDHYVDSFREGGLDYLWEQRQKLGLPRAVTDAWLEMPAFINMESNVMIHPARIPAKDQVLAYAAQMNASYSSNFLRTLDVHLQAGRQSVSLASRHALCVWKAYAFLAPGGRAYDPKRTVAAQSGQPFGSATAVQYLVHQAKNTQATAGEILDAVTTDLALNHVEWVRIAKVRVAEAFFMERLLAASAELLPF